jgi:hypothetical protein
MWGAGRKSRAERSRRERRGSPEVAVMFKRILVATDGSVHSRRAALTAADLARALGASLTLLAVYQQPPGFEGEPDYSRDLETALGGAHALLEAEAAAIQADGGPPAEMEAIGGSQPGRTIVDATARGNTTCWSWGREVSAVSGARSSARSPRTWRRTAPSRSSSSTEPTDVCSSARSRVHAAHRPGPRSEAPTEAAHGGPPRSVRQSRPAAKPEKRDTRLGWRARICMAPAPHVDGDPFWGLARSRRPGALPGAQEGSARGFGHPDG